MKKQKLPSKDWIGLAIDAVLKALPKNSLCKQDKIDLRAALSKFTKIGSIINPALEMNFSAKCTRADGYDHTQDQIEIIGRSNQLHVKIEVVRDNGIYWDAHRFHAEHLRQVFHFSK